VHEVHTKNVFFLSEILKPRFLKYFKKNILRNHKMTIALVVNFLRLNMITFKISSKLTNVHKNLWFFLQMLNLFSNNAWFKIQDVPFFGDRSLTTLWILQRMQMLRFIRWIILKNKPLFVPHHWPITALTWWIYPYRCKGTIPKKWYIL
jgi:hypothetical protein